MAGLWTESAPLVLASRSESRRDQLTAAGIPFDIVPADVDERAEEERFLKNGFGPDGLARALAEAKALAVSRVRQDSICLGADQVLVLGDRIFHKPSGRAEAEAAIADLSGQRHCLISGFCLARNGDSLASGSDRAFLTVRSLPASVIRRYLDLAGPRALSSVGAYQVEGLGVHLFDRIEGQHSTILGLPMLMVLAALRDLGALAL